LRRSAISLSVLTGGCVLAVMLAASARATLLTGASIEKQGKAVELSFPYRGHAPQWHLSIHGQELWIDLEGAELSLPPRPLFGLESAPIKAVRAIDPGGGHCRIIVQVDGRTDYAIAAINQQLILRMAPAGAVPDLAAPILGAIAQQRYRPRTTTARLAKASAARSRQKHHHKPPRRQLPVSAPPDSTLAEADPLSPARLSTPAALQPANSDSGDLRSAAYTVGRQPNAQPLVVIDPGHGGYDPGTSGGGYTEKALALQIADRLRSALNERGIRTAMTRDDDSFVSLSERTRIANRDGADLFVSIHLNSNPDSATAGITTYYLNNTTDRATIRLARMENQAGGYGAPNRPNLHYILTDLRQQYKAAESASLARMIEAEAVADVNRSVGVKVNDLGARKGPFYVLVGPLMPAVLVECGFLSNPAEARLLATPSYQQALADGIARAVVHYLNADAAVGNL
jgi:N-acetylmuramoyl-L-alanine amidase